MLTFLQSHFFCDDRELIVSGFSQVRAISFFRIEEELEVHYGKFAEAYRALSRGDLVSENGANLGNAERKFFPHDIVYALKVDKDSLSCFGPSIGWVLVVWADVCLEHRDKVLRYAKNSTAFWTFDVYQELG